MTPARRRPELHPVNRMEPGPILAAADAGTKRPVISLYGLLAFFGLAVDGARELVNRFGRVVTRSTRRISRALTGPRPNVCNRGPSYRRLLRTAPQRVYGTVGHDVRPLLTGELRRLINRVVNFPNGVYPAYESARGLVVIPLAARRDELARALGPKLA